MCVTALGESENRVIKYFNLEPGKFEIRTSNEWWLTIAENAFPATIDELAYGGELADVEVGELERQAATAGAVVENKVRQGRFPRHFATQG